MIQLSVNFDDGGEDEKRVAEILGLDGNELKAALEGLAAAALMEYVLAFSGERAPSTMKDLRELRLRLLYQQVGTDLTDGQIAQLYQMTPTQAGTLIAGTRARYRTELQKRLRDRAIDALKSATKVDENTVRFSVEDSLAKYMKELVNETNAPPLERSREAARTYEPRKGTIRALCSKLGIPVTDVKALDWS